MCVCVIGSVAAEELQEHFRRGRSSFVGRVMEHISKYFQSKWQLVMLLKKIHFMYSFQVLVCSIIQNVAEFVYDFKPTVAYIPTVFPALSAVNGQQLSLRILES